MTWAGKDSSNTRFECKICLKKVPYVNFHGICSKCSKFAYFDVCTFQIVNTTNWNREPKTDKNYWKNLKAIIPGESEKVEWVKRINKPKWKKVTFLHKRISKKNLENYLNQLPDPPNFNLKRLESTPNTFCLNPPYDKGKKIHIPFFKRLDPQGELIGRGKLGYNKIDVRSMHEKDNNDKARLLPTYWKDEHNIIIDRDGTVINDSLILTDEYSNQTYALDQQSREYYLSDRSHAILEPKVHDTTFEPGNWKKERGFINYQLNRINTVGSSGNIPIKPKQKAIKKSQKSRLTLPKHNKKQSQPVKSKKRKNKKISPEKLKQNMSNHERYKYKISVYERALNGI